MLSDALVTDIVDMGFKDVGLPKDQICQVWFLQHPWLKLNEKSTYISCHMAHLYLDPQVVFYSFELECLKSISPIPYQLNRWFLQHPWLKLNEKSTYISCHMAHLYLDPQVVFYSFELECLKSISPIPYQLNRCIKILTNYFV